MGQDEIVFEQSEEVCRLKTPGSDGTTLTSLSGRAAHWEI